MVKTETEVGPNSSKMYTIKDDKGEEIKAWGSTVLDDKLSNVPNGSYVKLDYEGKLKSAKGVNYHSFKVFIDLNEETDETSGYEKAKAMANSFEKKTVNIDESPIDLNDIPF